MSARVHVDGSAQAVLSLERVRAAVERELETELDFCAQILARAQRLGAPKFRSLLANSVTVSQPAPLERDVGPTAAYAEAQELGVKPGGKGLPRWANPASADIVAWLRATPFRGQGAGSSAAAAPQRELRDRYEGLAWHIRRKGVRATPFVARSLDEQRPLIERRLQAAVERAMQQVGSTA